MLLGKIRDLVQKFAVLRNLLNLSFDLFGVFFGSSFKEFKKKVKGETQSKFMTQHYGAFMLYRKLTESDNKQSSTHPHMSYNKPQNKVGR